MHHFPPFPLFPERDRECEPKPHPDLLKEPTPEIAQLLAALEAIPRSELPDGKLRDLLAKLVRVGSVDNIYQPFGANYHNIAWADRFPWQDPRQRISDWLAMHASVQRDLDLDLGSDPDNAEGDARDAREDGEA